MDPLELLPTEVWQIIFEKVEDPQDWLNLYRASPTFEGVVGEDRHTALMSKVLPQLQKYLEEEEEGRRPKIGLLTLRLVSKRWKNAVDSALEEEEVEFGDQLEEYTSFQGMYNFEDSETISRFLDKFGAHPGNPLIGSFVRVQFDAFSTEEVRMEYRRSVGRLLERFGTHVKKLCIRDWERLLIFTNTSLDSFLDSFRSCLELAPNLEGLTVKFNAREGVDFPLDDNPNHGNGRNVPLPIISKLKSFVFAGHAGPDLMVGLQNLLVRLCCNPATLKTATMVGVPLELTTFPNLEAASVKVTPRLQEDAINLMNSAWPLSRLVLCPTDPIMPIMSCVNLEFPRTPLDSVVVECIQHFKETLTCLWIGNECIPPLGPNLELSLDLPRLTFLSMPRSFMSVRFMRKLQLPSLEELRIFEDDSLVGPFLHEDYHANNPRWKRVFEGVEAQLSKCKIWEVLPKLGKVRFEVIGERRVQFRLMSSVSKVYYRK